MLPSLLPLAQGAITIPKRVITMPKSVIAIPKRPVITIPKCVSTMPKRAITMDRYPHAAVLSALRLNAASLQIAAPQPATVPVFT